MAAGENITQDIMASQDDEPPRPIRLFKPGMLFGDKQSNKPSSSSAANVHSNQQPQPSTSKHVVDDPDQDMHVEAPAAEVNSGSDKIPPASRVPQYKPNTIVINPKQRENPLLKCLRLPHAVDESIVPDYVLTKNCCAFFLSIRYHNLKPTYIYDRFNELGNAFSLRILLLMVDVPEPRNPLKELTKFAALANATLMACWSYEEAAKFLELYKQFEFKSPEILMEKQFANDRGTESPYECVVDALTTVKRINKTDAITLLANFDSLENIVKSTPDRLSLCPGLAKTKADQLHAFFRRPFTR